MGNFKPTQTFSAFGNISFYFYFPVHCILSIFFNLKIQFAHNTIFISVNPYFLGITLTLEMFEKVLVVICLGKFLTEHDYYAQKNKMLKCPEIPQPKILVH